MKHIISIEVKNSTFFGSPLIIDFSENLNCIMGSRGTGKSTILQFIKSCLDYDAEENRTTLNVLKNNLGNGTIILTISDGDGKKYKIEKTFEEYPQCYTLPKNSFVELNKIAHLINCDIYEAQAIEEIGKNSLSRLELIDKMITSDKAEIEVEISALQLQLDENTQLLKSENSRLAKLNVQLKSFDGIEDELLKCQQEKPEDINKKEEIEFSNADKTEKIRTAEKRFTRAIKKKYEDLSNGFAETLEDLSTFKELIEKRSAYHNKDLTDAIAKEALAVINEIQASLAAFIKKITSSSTRADISISQLNDKHSIQQNEFTKLRQRFEKHKEFYTRWNVITKKVDEKASCIKDADLIKIRTGKILNKRKVLISDLNKQKRALFELRLGKIELLNKSFKGAIKITLKSGGITDEYEQALKNALRGSNMRYNAIIPLIVQNFPPDKFASIVLNRETDTLKNITGIDKERSDAIFNALQLTDDLFQIEKMYCPDLPEFHLKVDIRDGKGQTSRSDYRKSEELSTGQRCTTVLPIVFAVSENPLIIDQPEDNLDNKYISESIHEIIGSQKNTRQLIFITHNPNIPVLSEAEQNFFLAYSDKKSRIDAQGKIDDVKNNILSLLEGGKEAFEKREALYDLKDIK